MTRLQENLLAYYPVFGNGSDHSGNGRHATVTKCSLSNDYLERLNRSYKYASGSYLATPAIDLSTTWSIAGRFKTPSADTFILGNTSFGVLGTNKLTNTKPPDGAIFGNNVASNKIQVYTSSALGSLILYFHDTYCYGSTYIKPSTWYHFVATGDNTNIKLYLNGLLENSVARSGDPASQIYYIGEIGAVIYPWTGSIGEIRIYDRTLSQDDVNQLYAESFNNYSSLFNGIRARWLLNNSVIDMSGSGWNLTKVGVMQPTVNYLNQQNSAMFNNGGMGSYFTFTALGSPNYATTGLTMAVWAKVNPTVNGTHELIGIRDSSSLDHLIRITTGGSLYSRCGAGTTITVSAGSNLNDNTWHFYTSTFSLGSVHKIYCDGTVYGSVTNGTGFTLHSGVISTYDFGLGAGSFLGSICDAMLFLRELSGSEVKELYELSRNKNIYPYMPGGRE